MTKEKCRDNQKRQHYYSQFLLAWKKISRTFSKKRHILMYWQSLISFDMIGYRNHVYNVKWKIFRVLSSALYEKEIFSMRYSHQRELILREVLSRSDIQPRSRSVRLCGQCARGWALAPFTATWIRWLILAKCGVFPSPAKQTVLRARRRIISSCIAAAAKK